MIDLHEEWRPVTEPDFSSIYVVSNFGRVKRICDGFGKAATHGWKNRVLNGTTTRLGYVRVEFLKPDFRRVFYVHRLVATAFLGQCPDNMECCHNDGNPANNRITNLRWATRKENQLDRRGHGKVAYSPNKRKLSDQQVHEIRNHRLVGLSCHKIASMFGVGPSTVSRICTGRRRAFS